MPALKTDCTAGATASLAAAPLKDMQLDKRVPHNIYIYIVLYNIHSFAESKQNIKVNVTVKQQIWHLLFDLHLNLLLLLLSLGKERPSQLSGFYFIREEKNL